MNAPGSATGAGPQLVTWGKSTICEVAVRRGSAVRRWKWARRAVLGRRTRLEGFCQGELELARQRHQGGFDLADHPQR